MFKAIKKSVIIKLMNNYKRRKQLAGDFDVEDGLKAIGRILDKTRYAFLITSGSQQGPNARYVETIVDPGSLNVWIGTNPSLRKVAEIRADPNVTIAFGNERMNANLVIYGTATIETDLDLRKKYWLPHGRLFFPGGPLSDDYVLIKVAPQRLELMDFSQSIVPEPFGLKPVVMEAGESGWRIRQ